MATDILAILKNILEFADFNNKTVIAVGAGGGQFAEYGRKARRIIAVDINLEALEALQNKVAVIGLMDRFEYHSGDFNTFTLTGDMIFFEFCFHEMADPVSALAKAKSMAPQILIFDHSPDSPWAYIAAEETKVMNAWQVIQAQNPNRVQHYPCLQSFTTFAELETKVMPQGEVSLQRIEPYRGQENITIPMSYGLALL
jgi:16S rRNA G966 N2-methylase RsmD